MLWQFSSLKHAPRADDTSESRQSKAFPP